MPHEDDLGGESLSGISFAEPGMGDEEGGEDDVLSSLSNGLSCLDIKDPAVHRHISIKVSSASVRKLSHCEFQMQPASKRED
jgi:hypothetical protein